MGDVGVCSGITAERWGAVLVDANKLVLVVADRFTSSARLRCSGSRRVPLVGGSLAT